jgi:hypothetical protein
MSCLTFGISLSPTTCLPARRTRRSVLARIVRVNPIGVRCVLVFVHSIALHAASSGSNSGCLWIRRNRHSMPPGGTDRPCSQLAQSGRWRGNHVCKIL